MHRRGKTWPNIQNQNKYVVVNCDTFFEAWNMTCLRVGPNNLLVTPTPRGFTCLHFLRSFTCQFYVSLWFHLMSVSREKIYIFVHISYIFMGSQNLFATTSFFFFFLTFFLRVYPTDKDTFFYLVVGFFQDLNPSPLILGTVGLGPLQ